MSAKRGNVAPSIRNATGGRTTSPPAPRQRSAAAAQPQPARISSTSGGTDGRVGGPVTVSRGAAAPGQRTPRSARTDSYTDPRSRELRGRGASRDLRVAQYVQNSSTLPVPGSEAGDEELAPISCVAFDATGDHFAYGDRTGRCYVFKHEGRMQPLQSRQAIELPHLVNNGYRLIDVIEAYQPQLDTLNSMEIEARVNVIRFVKRGGSGIFFLSANDKTIKLWKVWERAQHIIEPGYDPTQALLEGWTSLKMPTVRRGDKGVWHKEVKVFAADHEYHVNSISVSSNMDNFLTSDDLTVHLWDVAHHERSLRVVDRKPEHMEELSETITSSAYHPRDPCQFVVASSKGVLTVYDLRRNMQLNAPALTLPGGPPLDQAGPQMEVGPGPSAYLASILAGVSHVQYSPCGTYLAARDYMTVKIWDARVAGTPLRVLRVHEHLEPRKTELYETDCMFDRFELAFDPSGQSVITGSYRSEFVQLATDGSNARLYQHMGKPQQLPHDPPIRAAGLAAPPPPQQHEEEDFKRKALHICAHPTEPIVAVASGPEVYLHVAE
eukprot:TRINITY_DN47280_c0_g1_i1.p1 TRINITY_DN47280_c0_g1~~TRINITY_DN47280_c0_g1_i1.p1  ORF type:complete len:580 (+),score=131.23 TRINITY_DN47280_c0_g1_i1:87-1742(+)